MGSQSYRSVNPETRKKSIKLHADALQQAAWLGVDSMLMVPGAVSIPWDEKYGPVKYDDAVKWATEAAKQLAPVAEKVGVELCLENVWNGMFYSPIEFAAFIDSIGSPKVGVYFDVGNVLGYHQHPPHWIEILGKRIRASAYQRFQEIRWKPERILAICWPGDVPLKESIAALRADRL